MSKINNTLQKGKQTSRADRIKEILIHGFVTPFTDVPLKGLYFASLLFAFGFTAIDLFFVLDFAALGPLSVMKMMLSKYVVACLFLLPAMMMLSKILSKKVLMSIYIIFPAISLGVLYNMAGQDLSPVLIGIVYAMSCSSFWAMYHVSMVAHSSDHNKGNEISIAVNGLNIGCIGGFFAGGILSQMNVDAFTVAAGGATMMFTAIVIQSIYFLRTNVLEALSHHNSHAESVWEAFKKHPRRSLGTFLQGLFDVPSKAAWPLFMTISGVSAIAAGSVQAITTIFKLVSSPWIGHWVNSGNGKEMSYGSSLQAAGWLPWLFVNTPILVSFSSFTWALGTHFYDIGLSKRWYSCRSVAGVVAREVVLGLGRCVAALAIIPLLLISPYLFAAAAFIVAIMMISLANGYIKEGIKLASSVAE